MISAYTYDVITANLDRTNHMSRFARVIEFEAELCLRAIAYENARFDAAIRGDFDLQARIPASVDRHLFFKRMMRGV